MCEFKYCRGTGKCFLSKTSPCAGLDPKSDAPKPVQKSRPRSLRVSYAGFLDHEELIDILDQAEETPELEEEQVGGLIRNNTPRILRRWTAMGRTDKRSVA